MWGGERERSPVLGAPGSNDYSGLIAGSTNAKSGSDRGHFQDDLCKRYRPLAFKIAGKYRDRGVDDAEINSACLWGLFSATRKFDPSRGVPFGGYAQYSIRGEILALFKKRSRNTYAPLDPKQADDLVHIPSPNLHQISPRERAIVEARYSGETLRSVGKKLGVSAERVRQIETGAIKKLRKGSIGLACIRDLLKRRGYRKPSYPLLPLRSVTYPCRTYSQAEIEAYARGEL